jgi:hypothetical protein
VVSLGDSENAIRQTSIFKPSGTLGGSENAIKQTSIFKPSGTFGGSEIARTSWVLCVSGKGE